MNLRTVALSLVFVFAVAACGTSEAELVTASVAETSSPATSSQPDDSASEPDPAPADDSDTIDVSGQEFADEVIGNAEDFAGELVDDLENAQAASGGGSATLTVGDQTWTFAPVLCAFGEDEIGQVDAEFVLSAIQDGKQMYFSIDQFGHSASLNDIKDFENPSVDLNSFGAESVISLDGKDFSGSAEFLDGTNESFETIPGTFSGTCP